MTTMTAPTIEFGKLPVRLPTGKTLWKSLARTGRRAIRMLRNGPRPHASDDAAGTAAPAAVSRRVCQDLEAIGSYANFIAKHPDMPAYHRERMLARIEDCSEDARAELGRPAIIETKDVRPSLFPGRGNN